jgi:hypothetical protein
MATAIIAGIAAYGAAAGSATFAAYAVAIGVAAAAGTVMMEQMMKPDAPDTPGAVQLGDKGTPIDKSTAQQDAEVGKLKLGEADDKKKRKKGKAAYKVELDEKKKAEGDTGAATGVQVQAPKDVGVQL